MPEAPLPNGRISSSKAPISDQEIEAFLENPQEKDDRPDVKLKAKAPDTWEMADKESARDRLGELIKAAGVSLRMRVMSAKDRVIEIEFTGQKTLISERVIQRIEALGIQFTDPIPLERK